MAEFLEAEGEMDSGAKQSKEYASALFSVGEGLGWVGVSNVI